MVKHWRAIAGILFLLQPAWGFIKWALDWAGRFDLIASHLHDLGVQAALDFLSNPPAWSFLPSVGMGLVLIWWDTRRKEVAALDSNQKLLIGFYCGCAVLCIGVWLAAWLVSIPAKAAPMSVAPAPVVTPKPPPPSWVSKEEIEEASKIGRVLLPFKPEELGLMSYSYGSEAMTAYAEKWVKISGPFEFLVQKKLSDKKEYIIVALKSTWTTELLFDPKKWQQRLVFLRRGDQLNAFCQLYPFSGNKGNTSGNPFIGINCELRDAT